MNLNLSLYEKTLTRGDFRSQILTLSRSDSINTYSKRICISGKYGPILRPRDCFNLDLSLFKNTVVSDQMAS